MRNIIFWIFEEEKNRQEEKAEEEEERRAFKMAEGWGQIGVRGWLK